MARKVDLSLLKDLAAGAVNQEIKKGFSKTTDSRFPVFSTPVDEDIVVYIPKTNVVETENGTDMQLLVTHIHDYRQGKGFGQLRCISGLEGGVYSQLGYDGTCPACEAMNDEWTLYKMKLEAEAKKLGIADPQNDPAGVLKSVRTRILGEMCMKNPEEYVTFPVVIIPMKGKMTPTDDAVKNLKVEFVTWRKKRYEDNILAALDSLMANPGIPAGMFWLWKFTYNTEGKPANARDSAKNAKYTPVTEAGALAALSHLIPACEEAAKEFTNIKATEVLVCNQFMYKEDIEEKVNKIMANTRALIEAGSVGGTPTQPQLSGTNPLAGFGAIGTGATPNLGVAGSAVSFGE